jgi:pimeloyl-ACP methyl ester carboxylesterase
MMLRPMQIRANAEDAAFMQPAAAALSGRYPELRLPVTIMAGADDEVIDPEAHSVRLHRDLPDSQLLVQPGAGHMVHYAAPEKLAAAVTATT